MVLARPLLLCLLAAGLARADEPPAALRFVHDDCVMGVAYSPDGVTAASCDNAHLIHVWSTLSGRKLVTMRGHANDVASIRFTPDGRRLISGSYDNTVRMWNVATGTEIWRSNVHESTVYKIRVTRDGRRFATATTGVVIVWEMETRRPLRRLVGADPCAFSADGRYLAAEVANQSVAVYDVASGRLAQRFTPREKVSVSSLEFTPDGRSLVAGLRNGDVVVHDVASGARVRCMAGHAESARGLAISPDGRLVASGSWDTSIRLWELASGGELACLTAHKDYVLSLSFSPDGTRLLSGARDNLAILWDLEAWRRRLAAPETSSRAGSFAGPASGRLSALPAGGPRRWWADLADRDARVAYAAILAFAGAGDRAVAFLAARPELERSEQVPPAVISAAVRDLDGSAYARDRARRRLRRHGLAAEAALTAALNESDSPEVRREAARLLAELSPRGWRPGDLRLVRAIHALQRIGTPAARRLLGRLARDLEPRLAREARFALQGSDG